MNTFLIESPVGPIICRMQDELIEELVFATRSVRTRAPQSAAEKEVARQLKEYFSGKRRAFELPLIIRGTDFQQRVLRELWHIEYGETISYADLALRAGAPKAVRAVANVMASNKIPVILPCHRIIASDGGLGGYSGGLRKKKFLLGLESIQEERLVEVA